MFITHRKTAAGIRGGLVDRVPAQGNGFGLLELSGVEHEDVTRPKVKHGAGDALGARVGRREVHAPGGALSRFMPPVGEFAGHVADVVFLAAVAHGVALFPPAEHEHVVTERGGVVILPSHMRLEKVFRVGGRRTQVDDESFAHGIESDLAEVVVFVVFLAS